MFFARFLVDFGVKGVFNFYYPLSQPHGTMGYRHDI